MLIDSETDIKICKIHGVHSFSIILTFLWAVGILYVTLGFRQFSHHFTVIRTALERGDQPAARAALAEWQGIALDAVPASDLPRQAIECAALAVHKHVLGVLVCFMVGWMLGLGPAGAVLFRLACYLAETCEPVSASTVDVLDGSQPVRICGRVVYGWNGRLF